MRPHSKLQVRPPRRPLPPFTSATAEDGFEAPVAPALRGSRVRSPNRSPRFVFILHPHAAVITSMEEGREPSCIVLAKEMGVRPHQPSSFFSTSFLSKTVDRHQSQRSTAPQSVSKQPPLTRRFCLKRSTAIWLNGRPPHKTTANSFCAASAAASSSRPAPFHTISARALKLKAAQ